MKENFIILIFSFFISNNIYSQFTYYNENCSIPELSSVYEQYTYHSSLKGGLILIDYKQKGDTAKFLITNSPFWYEVLFRRPDGYYYDDKHRNMFYLYTENYISVTDPLWCEQVLRKTCDALSLFPSYKVCWQKNKLLDGQEVLYTDYLINYEYGLPLELSFKQGKLLKDNSREYVYYPDIYCFENTYIPREKPFWRSE